jgi:hypothetical protein
VRTTPAVMAAQDTMVAREETEATAWRTRTMQAKDVDGCREEERGLGSRLHSDCLVAV